MTGPMEQWAIEHGITVDVAIAGSLVHDKDDPHGPSTEDVVPLNDLLAFAREQDAERAALEQQVLDLEAIRRNHVAEQADLRQRVAVLVKVLRDLDICPPEHTDCEAPTHIAYRAALAQNGGE